MRYMLSIYSEESYYGKLSEQEMGELMAGYGRFGEEAGKAGVLREGARLQPTATATTVRVRDGKLSTTDGPFAETKEAIGGYYIIDVPNLDEALAWAQKIPTATYGSIEVRPIWEMEE